MNRISTKMTFVAALSLLAVSCQRDDIDGVGETGSTTTVFYSPAVSCMSEQVTRSDFGETITINAEDVSLQITQKATCQEIRNCQDGNVPITKGELVNRTGTASIDFPTDGTFFVTAWDSEGTAASFDWSEVKYFETILDGAALQRNMWNTIDGDGKIVEHLWKQNVTKTFYAYANLPEGAGTASIITDGTTGYATGMSVAYTVPATASAQEDLLLGIYSGAGDSAGDGKQDGTASIVFQHALASVVLKMGTIVGAASFEITGLEIEGVYETATAVMTPVSATEASIVWTPELSGDKPVTTSVSQAISTTPAEGKEIGEPFIIIPQDFSTCPARLKISIKIDDRPVEVYLPLASGSWTAGCVNSYTIDYNGHEGIQLWENGPYWATKNVGAEKPEDYGWYFSWGNATGYICKNVSSTPVQEGDPAYSCEYYSAVNGNKRDGGFSSTSYENPGLGGNIPVNDTNDAAYKNMGKKWRMPTKQEFDNLLANTTMEYKKRNGVDGYLFKGKEGYSKRSIFIPASGFGNGESISFKTKVAFLRSSTYSSGVTYSLSIGYNNSLQEDNTNHAEVVGDLNYGGRTIRAVENTNY